MNILAGWPVRPGMRASVYPRRGQTIKEMGRKDADTKLILDVQPGYVVCRNDRNGNYSLLRRKTLWRYVVTAVPEEGKNVVRVTIEHGETGEIREWSMSDAHLRLIYRALVAFDRVPAYLAGRFEFSKPRRRPFIGGVPQRRR